MGVYAIRSEVFTIVMFGLLEIAGRICIPKEGEIGVHNRSPTQKIVKWYMRF